MSRLIANQVTRNTQGGRLNQVYAEGEHVWLTDLNQLWVGDGITPGGLPVNDPGFYVVDGGDMADRGPADFVFGNYLLLDGGTLGLTIGMDGGMF